MLLLNRRLDNSKSLWVITAICWIYNNQILQKGSSYLNESFVYINKRVKAHKRENGRRIVGENFVILSRNTRIYVYIIYVYTYEYIMSVGVYIPPRLYTYTHIYNVYSMYTCMYRMMNYCPLFQAFYLPLCVSVQKERLSIQQYSLCNIA